MDNLPQNVRLLELDVHNNSLDHLPPITHLTIRFASGELLLGNPSWHACHLPESLTRLEIVHLIAEVDHLPPNLTHLTITIWCSFYRAIDQLPQSLTHLKMHLCARLVDHLPPKLRVLKLGNFNEHIDNLPSSLLTLKLGEQFDKNLDHLPSGLSKLQIHPNYSKGLEYIPASCVVIRKPL